MAWKTFWTIKELSEGGHDTRGPVRPLPFYGILPCVGQFWARCKAAWAVLKRRAVAVRWY